MSPRLTIEAIAKSLLEMEPETKAYVAAQALEVYNIGAGAAGRAGG